MEGGECLKMDQLRGSKSLVDIVLSWSFHDILNVDLFRNKVKWIPDSFLTAEEYMESFMYPLLEETRAKLASRLQDLSRAPYASATSFEQDHATVLQYLVKVDSWKNRESAYGNHRLLVGDVLLLSATRPEVVSELPLFGKECTLGLVTETNGDTSLKVIARKDSELDKLGDLFVVSLMNLTTNTRIWYSLQMGGSSDIIRKMLGTNSSVEERCSLCAGHESPAHERLPAADLDESQMEVIRDFTANLHCKHTCSVNLVCGPPGSGKTKTLSTLLLALLGMNCTILVCAPTDLMVTGVASLFIEQVKNLYRAETSSCPVGNVLLVTDAIEADDTMHKIWLDYRIKSLEALLDSQTGWKHSFSAMTNFLERCVSRYQGVLTGQSTCRKSYDRSFIKLLSDGFHAVAGPVRQCISTLSTQIPRIFLSEDCFNELGSLNELLDLLENLLATRSMNSELRLPAFSESESHPFRLGVQCLSGLKKLMSHLNELEFPGPISTGLIEKFCIQNASIIFCGVSCSWKLQHIRMQPLNWLVIDDAAHVKECESIIPLQLPGVMNLVLFGNQCQLPVSVTSQVSANAGLGRSLMERLMSINYPRHFLNIQHRMHPSISSFPLSRFCRTRVADGCCASKNSCGKCYLQGSIFRPYSFINVSCGREEMDRFQYSHKNMVEVAIVVKIVQKLVKEWTVSRQKLSVGIISAYLAQVVAIQEKLGQKYDNLDGFSLKVKPIVGFQGQEVDIVILTTVRSNNTGSVGFNSDLHQVNVGLTRARHCLWIVGDGKTLSNSDSVWRLIVDNANDRQCFFDAEEDDDLAKVMVEVKNELNQLVDLLDANSALFTNARWKVLFNDNFRKSFQNLESQEMKKIVINFLLRLATGWRPRKKSAVSFCDDSLQILKKFKVKDLYIVTSVDIVRESSYMQALKLWDLLPLEDIPNLAQHLNAFFAKYTDEHKRRCKLICISGNLEVPMTWDTCVARYVTSGSAKFEVDSTCSSHKATAVERCNINESLLLMKFYALSSDVVSHMLSGCDRKKVEFPFELTDQEQEVICLQKSSFVLGRSGTGKTTVIIMKLFQREQLYHIASQGFHYFEGGHLQSISQWREKTDSKTESKEFLCQMFLTVNPRLCYVVNQQICRLKRSTCGWITVESNDNEETHTDGMLHFLDIPDSFIDLPSWRYPLVITYNKFLMMLDGTMGTSFFEKFPEVRALSRGRQKTSKSVTLQTLIQAKEVTYAKFLTSYWPHFDTKLTKSLDPCIVFKEIISFIKGGCQEKVTRSGVLNREDYVILHERRGSFLNRQEREWIYDIFVKYEKLKTGFVEFDLADLVINLHCRMMEERYEGNLMDFVYIDEVQDLTMRQISLFKYICKNSTEGFFFTGDTAQAIAKGVDFRFQDVRSLFYKDFLPSPSHMEFPRSEKGLINEIFRLSQNFRTHVGILKLAQSVIDILYHFFPFSIDKLDPETSLIDGDPPVLVETLGTKESLLSLFKGSDSNGPTLAGFGAEQAILVRDEAVKNEVLNQIGLKALLLTVIECKGLEFQDVLLYNFFSSSPLRDAWRSVIYSYMKEKNLFSSGCQVPLLSFNKGKHMTLCAEMKQLYVAITRTRQRLWIIEDDGFENPMFHYWQSLQVVQVRRLDCVLLKEMETPNSQEEWKSRGMKFYHQESYDLAKFCFKKSGEDFWVKLAEAAGLRSAADCNRLSIEDCVKLTTAAQIYESIRKFESAAQCFIELKEYEKAGNIYLKHFGESKLDYAAECLYLAKLYGRAAEIYAKRGMFLKCLSSCADGELFEAGWQYFESWKEQRSLHNSEVNGNSGCWSSQGQSSSKEIQEIQNFLERGARYFLKVKDDAFMMKFVKAFHSEDSSRRFLEKMNLLDELLCFEKECGNFLKAAKVAEKLGYILEEADLRAKGGQIKDACMIILSYVFVKSLWGKGKNGWPLQNFLEKKSLLQKAKTLAKQVSKKFSEFVILEANILSDSNDSFANLCQSFDDSVKHDGIRGGIVSSRKIIDFCLCSTASWKCFAGDLMKYTENRMSWMRVSVEKLIFCWDFWRREIAEVCDNLRRHLTEENGYTEFCLIYYGLKKQLKNNKTAYLLIFPDMEWTQNYEFEHTLVKGCLVSMHQFSVAAYNYWSSEIISVGMKLVEKLEALHQFAVNKKLAISAQTTLLVHMFNVSNFLFNSDMVDHCRYKDTLDRWRKFSMQNFFNNVFPLDWKKSLAKDMINVREKHSCRDIFVSIISVVEPSNAKLTNGELGRVLTFLLARILPCDIYEQIVAGLDNRSLASVSVHSFRGNRRPESAIFRFLKDYTGFAGEVKLVQRMYGVLIDTCFGDVERRGDYMLPTCFVYIVERLLIMVSYRMGYFFATRSSLLEWFVYQKWQTENVLGPEDDCYLQPSFEDVTDVVACIISEILCNEEKTKRWISKCNLNLSDYQLLVSRLVAIMCLLCINAGRYYNLLFSLLSRNEISALLPWEFMYSLRLIGERSMLDLKIQAILKAMKVIGNPLVAVALRGDFPKFPLARSAIFLDLRVPHDRDSILVKLELKNNIPFSNQAGSRQCQVMRNNWRNR